MVDTRGHIERRVSLFVGRLFAPLPLTPNQWTFLSLVCALGASVALFLFLPALAFVLFLVASFLDVVDGAVARFRGRVTALGAFLDGVFDRFVEFLVLVPLLLYPLPSLFFPSSVWIVSVLFFGTCMTSFVRAYAHHRGVVDEETVGFIGGFLDRFKRLALILLTLALIALGALTEAVGVLSLISVLAAFTVGERIVRVVWVSAHQKTSAPKRA